MNFTLKPFINRLLLFTALLITGRATLAQPANTSTALPHTLLWRISGKGLSKPSYLYGTLHLNDKRLFRFGDSVYRAIETTEGLAIEVNPDEMAAYIVNKMFDQIENGKKLQEVVDKRYFNNNRKALAKKFNKPAEEISTSDIIKEKNKWMAQYMENGEMPTFMDAYLYNTARRQGKWLGGIEDLTDQTGLMADLVDQSDISYLLTTDSSTRKSASDETIEKMIGLYLSQDLQGIEDMSNHSTAEQKDELLIHRNVKMARRIDSLASLRTMFLAIGAAHLPGDSGVITLLRSKGFTVEPVFSNKKIPSADYTFKEVRLPWVRVTDNQGAYTVEMPANPATVKLYGLVEMKFLMDLFNMSGFCTTAVINANHHANRDSLLNGTAARMFRTKTAIPVKNVEKNGIAGKEYIHMAKGENLRIQIFADAKMVYIALLSSMKKEMLSSEDAEKFFRSFSITPQKAETSASLNTFADSIMGISFETPARLSYNAKMSNNKDASWKVACYSGADQTTGTYVALFNKEVKPGYHIPDQHFLHDQYYKLLSAQYTNLQRDSTTLDSVDIIKLTGAYTEQAGIYLKAISLIKNGRNIVLMVVGDSAAQNSPSLKSIFSSLRFIPHPEVNWRKYYSPDSIFSSYAPSPIRTHSYETSNSSQWVSYDSTTATSYLVIPDTLGKYVWYASDSLFWETMLKGFKTGENDLEIKTVANGGMPGREYMYRNKKTGRVWTRSRLLITGDKIYKLTATAEKDLLCSPDVDKFFDQFRLTGAASPSTAFLSKAALLIHDLGSADSATFHEAYAALGSATFGKEDKKLLEEAVFRSYQPLYTGISSIAINNTIARKLAKIADSGTISFVRNSYPTLVKEKDTLRNTAIYLLALQQNTHSYTVLAELLKQGPTVQSLDYTGLYAIKDSLPLAASLFHPFVSWIKDTIHVPAVASIALSLLDSGYLSKDSIRPYAGAFIEAAAALLPGLKAREYYQDFNMVSLVRLIGRFHTPAANSLLNDYLSVRNKYLLEQVVNQLLEGGRPIPPSTLNRLAAAPSSRTWLYNTLKEQKKIALFPKLYLTQSRFAESSVYSSMDEQDEEGSVDTVLFLSKKIASYHGKSYTWYLYKVSYTNEDGTRYYLGIAGGYDPVAGGLRPKKDLTGVYREEDFDSQKIDSFFKAYLKNWDQAETGQ